MSNILKVDSYLNLNHVESDQLNTWLNKADARSKFEDVVELVTNDASNNQLQRALLDLEEFTTTTKIDIPGIYHEPKDVRIEVTTEDRHITLGWHDNGGSSNCYVHSDKFRG